MSMFTDHCIKTLPLSLLFVFFNVSLVNSSLPDISSDALNRAQSALKNDKTSNFGHCKVCRILTLSFEKVSNLAHVLAPLKFVIP